MNFLKNNYFSILLLALLVKALAIGVALPEALMFLGLLGILGYKEYTATKVKIDYAQSVEDRIKELKSAVDWMKVAQGRQARQANPFNPFNNTPNNQQ